MFNVVQVISNNEWINLKFKRKLELIYWKLIENLIKNTLEIKNLLKKRFIIELKATTKAGEGLSQQQQQ